MFSFSLILFHIPLGNQPPVALEHLSEFEKGLDTCLAKTSILITKRV